MSYAHSWGGVFDITRYGAISGGTTDCTPAIVAATNDAIAAGGGIVWFPTGTWRVATFTGILAPATDSTLIFMGAGSGAKILVDCGANVDFLRIQASGGSTIVFQDLTFLPKTPGATNVNALLYVEGTQEEKIIVDRCHFVSLRCNYQLFRHSGGIISYYDTTWDATTVLGTFGTTGLVFSYDCLQVNITNCQIIQASGSAYGLYIAAWPEVSGGDKIEATSVQINGLYCRGSQAIYLPGTAPGFSYPGDHRYARIQIRNSYFKPDSVAPMIQINAAEHVEIDQCWIGANDVLQTGIQLTDAGDVEIKHLTCDVMQSSGGPSNITADALTRSLKLIDCIFRTAVHTSNLPVIEIDGVRGRLYTTEGATEIVNQYALVKPSATDLHCTTVGTSDALSLAMGSAFKGTQATGTINVPTAANLSTGETFPLSDGVTSKTYEFRKSGNAAPGNVKVDISGATTANDVRDALITAINGASYGITASIGGTGQVALVNTLAGGLAGNVPMTTGTVADITDFVVRGMFGGSQQVAVSDAGQWVTLLSDGAGAIAPADAIANSGATAGRVKKVTSGGILGRSGNTAAASANALVKLLWQKEQF